jgi:hypothetical protein
MKAPLIGWEKSQTKIESRCITGTLPMVLKRMTDMLLLSSGKFYVVLWMHWYQKSKTLVAHKRILEFTVCLEVRVGQTQHFSNLLVPHDTWLLYWGVPCLTNSQTRKQQRNAQRKGWSPHYTQFARMDINNASSCPQVDQYHAHTPIQKSWC